MSTKNLGAISVSANETGSLKSHVQIVLNVWRVVCKTNQYRHIQQWIAVNKPHIVITTNGSLESHSLNVNCHTEVQKQPFEQSSGCTFKNKILSYSPEIHPYKLILNTPGYLICWLTGPLFNAEMKVNMTSFSILLLFLWAWYKIYIYKV